MLQIKAIHNDFLVPLCKHLEKEQLEEKAFYGIIEQIEICIL